jgi:ribosomal protein S18 acetylase RimI-like enzyme
MARKLLNESGLFVADEMRMLIRPYREADQAAVVQLWMACGLVVPHNNPVRDIERKLQVNPEWFLVGEVDNEVVATCMVGYEGHRGWVNYLAVRPDLQGQGLGRQMMDAAEAILRDAGCPKINLQIRTTNQKVIRFYESIGYQMDDVVSMGKRLEPDNPHEFDRLSSNGV